MKYFIILIIILTRLLSFGQMKDKSLLTFKVSDVNQATKPLKTDSAKKIFENKLGYKIQYAPSNHLNAKFVYSANNTLIQTIQECYDNHRPLVLSPDIIWLSICQGISIHINENFDSLKKNLLWTISRYKMPA